MFARRLCFHHVQRLVRLPTVRSIAFLNPEGSKHTSGLKNAIYKNISLEPVQSAERKSAENKLYLAICGVLGIVTTTAVVLYFGPHKRMSRLGLRSELEDYLRTNPKAKRILGPIKMFYDGRSGRAVEYKEETSADGIKRASFRCEVESEKCRAVISCQVNEHQKKNEFERLSITPYVLGKPLDKIRLVDGRHQQSIEVQKERRQRKRNKKKNSAEENAKDNEHHRKKSRKEKRSSEKFSERGGMWGRLFGKPKQATTDTSSDKAQDSAETSDKAA
eukprot:GILK01009455.1.p1 GENE.GILK01009455.1~~GILK01009455.1.p1  ORF type:complete len:276 (+),score=32.36 GILK01009455.1:26-853(+)